MFRMHHHPGYWLVERYEFKGDIWLCISILFNSIPRLLLFKITAESGADRSPVSRLPHESRSEDQSTDAKGTATPETRDRGRSQALLYNTIRPQASRG
jgi:hypothetical protein